MTGPVTAAIQAMRQEPEPQRRGFLRALAAIPLTGAIMGATSEAGAADLPEYEARFLALAPWLAEVVPPAERARWTARQLYEEGERAAGEHPGWSVPKVAHGWFKAAQAIRASNGYMAAAEFADELARPIVEAYAEFRHAHMTTIPAIAWKARLSLLLDESDDSILADMAALAGRNRSASHSRP